MTKFKIGDKVRVKKDLIPDKEYGNVSFVPSMGNMCGKIVTILAKANGYNYEAIQEMLKNATIKGKDMEVREVRRRAKVGEYVKIINAKDIDYKNGDILKIIDADVYVRYGYYLSQFLYDTEYVVLENYKPKEKKENA